jgi:hypothetical protein
MVNDQLKFAGAARYIGSLPKDDQMCDYYEVEVDGNISYVYIPIGPDRNANTP